MLVLNGRCAHAIWRCLKNNIEIRKFRTEIYTVWHIIMGIWRKSRLTSIVWGSLRLAPIIQKHNIQCNILHIGSSIHVHVNSSVDNKSYFYHQEFNHRPHPHSREVSWGYSQGREENRSPQVLSVPVLSERESRHHWPCRSGSRLTGLASI